jgi:hypothetical protein
MSKDNSHNPKPATSFATHHVKGICMLRADSHSEAKHPTGFLPLP